MTHKSSTLSQWQSAFSLLMWVDFYYLLLWSLILLCFWALHQCCESPGRVCQSRVFCSCEHKKKKGGGGGCLWRRASLFQHTVPRLNNKMNVSWIQPGTEAPKSARVARRTDSRTCIQSNGRGGGLLLLKVAQRQFGQRCNAENTFFVFYCLWVFCWPPGVAVTWCRYC